MADFRYRCVQKQVLSEDDYEAQLEKIIQRDFYPDLLRVKGDETKSPPPLSGTSKQDVERDADGFPSTKRFRPTLDGFQAMHTTEDDASFQTLIDLEQARRQKSLRWMLTDSAAHNERIYKQREQLLDCKSGPSNAEGNLIGGTIERQQTEQRGELMFNRHVAQSATIFPPDVKSDNFGRPLLPLCADSSTLDNSLALRSSESGVLANVAVTETLSIKPKVVHDRTRFSPEDQQVLDRLAVVAPERSQAVTEATRKADQFDECLERGRFSGVDDPRIVATPVIAPESLTEGPIMTWGSLISTPVVLPAEETTAVPSTTFSLPAPRKDDLVARNINTARRNRERQKKSYAQALRDELTALAGGSACAAVGKRTPRSSVNRNSIFSGLTPSLPAGSSILNTPLARNLMKGGGKK